MKFQFPQLPREINNLIHLFVIELIANDNKYKLLQNIKQQNLDINELDPNFDESDITEIFYFKNFFVLKPIDEYYLGYDRVKPRNSCLEHRKENKTIKFLWSFCSRIDMSDQEDINKNVEEYWLKYLNERKCYGLLSYFCRCEQFL